MTFNEDDAISNLQRREQEKSKRNEERRKQTLEQVKKILGDYFKDIETEVYLIGSLVVPNAFHAKSDIDIVLKGFKGDRFAVWTDLERELDMAVEIIYFEEVDFAEDIPSQGVRVK